MPIPSGAREGAVALSERYAGVVLDIDGVLVRGAEPIPGSAGAVERLIAAGVGIAFATNNAARTPEQVAAALRAAEVPATAEFVVTSAMAAAGMLTPGTRCLIIGMEGLRQALDRRGCVEIRAPGDAEAVVVGLDTDLRWDDLRRATLALAAGARFLGTNGDVTFPGPDGLWPGNGAVLAALTAATGRSPELAGKPHAPLLLAAADRLPPPEGGQRLLMVGDRHETDIVGAAALGWDTALVLSGVATAEDERVWTPPPTYVAPTLAALLRRLTQDSRV